MRMNIFKGARRSALVLCISWVGGCVIYGIFAKPEIFLTYSVSMLGEAPSRVPKCGQGDGSREFSARDSEGHPVAVKLCFKALKSQGRRWWMEASYSPDVLRKMDAFVDSFQLPEQGLAEVKRTRQEERFELWKHAAISAVSGVVIGWVLVAVIGWLVRAYLRIPRGQDFRRVLPPRPTAVKQTSSQAQVGSSQRGKRKKIRRFD